MTTKKSQAGFSLLELLLVLLIMLILALLGLRYWRRPMILANETAAVSDLRTIHTGAIAYYVKGRFFPPDPICMAVMLPCGSQPPGCPCYPEGDPFIDPTLGDSTGPTHPRGGYVRQWIPGPALAVGNSGFCYQAMPEVYTQTGSRSFGVDASGLIGAADGNVACCDSTGVVNKLACPAMR